MKQKLTWTNIYSNSRFILPSEPTSSSSCESAGSGNLQPHTPQNRTLTDWAVSYGAEPSHCVCRQKQRSQMFLTAPTTHDWPIRLSVNKHPGFLHWSHESWSKQTPSKEAFSVTNTTNMASNSSCRQTTWILLIRGSGVVYEICGFMEYTH